MAGPGCRLLRLACVTLTLTANCAAVTVMRKPRQAGKEDEVMKMVSAENLKCNGVILTAVVAVGNLVAATPCVTTSTPTRTTYTARAPYSSRMAAVLAPCLVVLAIVVMLGLALAVAKLQERRQTEGGFSPRRLEAPGGRNPPAEPGNTSISTLAARVERLV